MLLAKDVAFQSQLESCWDRVGGHLPLSPSGTTDVFCVTQKGTNSISEKSFPTLLCPQLSFTKLCQVALSCHRDAQNKPPKHQDLNAALFAVWPVRQVKCRALVMFYGCPRHYRVGMHEGKKKRLLISLLFIQKYTKCFKVYQTLIPLTSPVPMFHYPQGKTVFSCVQLECHGF